MIPQVATCSVGVTELLEILANALLEFVGAYVGLDHSKDARTLAIADLIEEFFDLFWSADFCLDRMGAIQTVSSHCSSGAVLEEVLPDLPLWISPVYYLVGHECSEAFVKPEV